MFYNDLSDNGKKFEFGYDSENDAYGYYKDGTFTEFGGGGVGIPNFIFGMPSISATNAYNMMMVFFWLDTTDQIYDRVEKMYTETTPFISNKFVSCRMIGGAHGSNNQKCTITFNMDCTFYDYASGTVYTKSSGDTLDRTYAQPFCCVWE